MFNETYSSMQLGPGEHVISEPIILGSHGQSLRGAGADATTLHYSGIGPAIRNVLPIGETLHWGIEIGGFTLIGGGIELDSTYKARIEDLRIRQAPGVGLRLYRSDPTCAFAAYNLVSNVAVDMVGMTGNGIVLDAGSECNELYGVNASYAQVAPSPVTHTEEPPDLTSGVGLLIASGNNLVRGGHLDRCAYPLVYLFAESNDVETATDNAMVRAMHHPPGTLGALAWTIRRQIGRSGGREIRARKKRMVTLPTAAAHAPDGRGLR